MELEARNIPRKIKEAIHILRDNPQLNWDMGWDLLPIYHHLLK
jgi:hypothetical protein